MLECPPSRSLSPFCRRKLRKQRVTRIHMNLFASMILQSAIRLVIYIDQVSNRLFRCRKRKPFGGISGILNVLYDGQVVAERSVLSEWQRCLHHDAISPRSGHNRFRFWPSARLGWGANNFSKQLILKLCTSEPGLGSEVFQAVGRH